MAEPDRATRAWGRCMLLEFAAKQQVVPLAHMFTDTVELDDLRQLHALSAAARAIASGQCGSDGWRRLLRFEGALEDAGRMLRDAAGAMTAEQAGMALALAYLPYRLADAFAVNVLRGATLKQMAAAIDPPAALAVRTRLFLAEHLSKAKTLRGLVACTAAAVVLRANAPLAETAELCAGDARPRLRRLAATADAWLGNVAALSEALGCCLAQDWRSAEAVARQLADRAAIDAGDQFDNPPALADLLLISLLPSCDTIDAAERLMTASRNSASRARAAAE